MPMPNWWRYLNKRFFNPRTLKTDHSWAMITHVGRKSGRTFSTPVEAIRVPGGFAVFLMYGRETDWSRNLLASGTGSISLDGKTWDITHPRIVSLAEIEADLPSDASRPPAILRVKELIRFDTVEA